MFERRLGFRLCAQLGVPTPDALFELMTLRQLYEWGEFYNEEPFGFVPADQMHANQVWAVLRSVSGEDWTGQPSNFLLRNPTAAAVAVEVDPVEWLAEMFGSRPPPRPDDGAVSE